MPETSVFLRMHTDDSVEPAKSLENSFGGPYSTPVFLIGSGPSLLDAPVDEIAAAPCPKFCMNLAGSNVDGKPPLIRPDLWTSYDPTTRFHRSIYLDPTVMKFICRSRKMDLIPGGIEKVCDAPNVYFFERKNRGYHDFLNPVADGILDCQDTMVQALDICYRLGFRTIYCVGCEMQIRPSQAQVEMAVAAGVEYDPDDASVTIADPQGTDQRLRRSTLRDFVTACKEKGLIHPCEACTGGGRINGTECVDCAGKGEIWEFLRVEREKQYAFSEQKAFQSALTTDEHYFRVSQHLRLARRNLHACGVQIVSCTKLSRLNDYFPYLSVHDACERVKALIGDPLTETTAGNYQNPDRPGKGYAYTKDFPPHKWNNPADKKPLPANVEVKPNGQPEANGRQGYRNRMLDEFEKLKSVPIEINEVG